MSDKIIRIGISGSYGGLNLGDEAILQSIIALLRKTFKNINITVFSRDTKDTLARHTVDRAVPVREMNKNEIVPEIRRLDLFILGGGGILFDAEAKLYLREVMLAREYNVPVAIYSISAGPLNDLSAQKFVRDTLNSVEILTVRERRAERILEDIGVTKEIKVCADPALLLEPEKLPAGTMESEGLKDAKNLIGISVREPGPASAADLSSYYSRIANAADYMVERFDARVVFVPLEREVMDIQTSHKVISKMLNAHKATVLKGSYSPGQLLSIFEHFVFGVGMRLHFLIFLALAGVPFVALPYASKVDGFLESLQIELPPEYLNPGRLIAYIDRSWDYRKKLTEQICERILPLKELALEPNRMITAFLKKSRPDRGGKGMNNAGAS